MLATGWFTTGAGKLRGAERLRGRAELLLLSGYGFLAGFVTYCLAASLGWDLGRAVLTVVLTITLDTTVRKALRRATRRAAFESQVTFDAPGA